ncbi:MAG: hypothetical protein FJ387_17625 [Verrucomicrobia bacterium]|nr:hypothetical protein [Verrucomicrobiota bacterium]
MRRIISVTSSHAQVLSLVLSSNALDRFGAVEVTIDLNAYLNADTAPPTVLLEARMPNGLHQVLLSDGSVLQVSNQRLQPYLAPSD